MRISCILTSFNRPMLVRQALLSVAWQTHRDYELLVMDESTIFDIHRIMAEFEFPSSTLVHLDVSAEERRSCCRLGIKCNMGLERATGDLICFLCDDDYFYPRWFSEAAWFFGARPDVKAAFGKLVYSSSPRMDYPSEGEVRFFNEPVDVPFQNIDHCQAMHRNFHGKHRWPERLECMYNPDAHYFAAIAKDALFHPIHELAIVKRRHPRSLQANFNEGAYAGDWDGAQE